MHATLPRLSHTFPSYLFRKRVVQLVAQRRREPKVDHVSQIDVGRVTVSSSITANHRAAAAAAAAHDSISAGQARERGRGSCS